MPVLGDFMEQIIKTFLGIVFAMIVMMTGISVINVQTDGTNARDFKNDVISELENSDFNPDIINECFHVATEKGYAMEVTIFNKEGTAQVYNQPNVTDTSGAIMANIKLDYNVKILGKTSNKSIMGNTR